MPEISSSGVSASSRAFSALLVFLVVSATYLYTFPQPNIFYAVIVLLHATTGVVAAVMLAIFFFRLLRNGSFAARAGWVLLAAGAVIGIVLIKTGTPRVEWNWLYVHILLSLAGVGILFADWAGNRGWLGIGAARAVLRLAICLLALAGLGYGGRYVRESRWLKHARIENPAMPPANMSGEGDGPEGAFFPSSAQVYGKRKIPSKFFMESDSCKRCHQDICNQWFSSAHHFSSFNNQWYRKSVEYMQDTIGPKPSKWCGGCHDPAVLYSGLMDTPIKQIVHRPESQAGLGCMMCHSIAKVKSTMGQGDFYLEYPKLHELAATKNPVARALHDFLIKLNPEPHRRVFLKPFMRDQTAEFCSSCHKVHLDVPVNHYRWIRGFNEYDNWQASGVSGQGARSFYYPARPAQCADCHMPLTQSKDMGNIAGFVHSHRFPGGTVDAYDTWLELKGTDDKGQTIFWSGMVEDDGKGPVEKGAHFYRSLQVDAHGNRINKRNAWATRAVVYVHLIPPGAADTVHYRVHIPENAGSKITLHARLCYRKFAWWNTQFSFAGIPDPVKQAEVTPDYDDRQFTFTAPLTGVSARREQIPNLPVEALAETEVTLNVAPHGARMPGTEIDLKAEDWQRWNDYGIGLFLQGDLKGAAAAFEKVTEVDPKNPDGWVNIGRAAVQEGDMDRARTVLEKALSLNPNLARAHLFYAKV